jgi:hypothetical protein
MTMPQGSAEEPTILLTEEPTVAVRVVSSGAMPSRSIGTEYGQWRTFLVANAVQANSVVPGAQRIIARSLRRKRCYIRVMAAAAASTPNNGVSYTSSNAPVTSPAAGGVLATTGIVSAGTYTVYVTLNLSGTAGVQGTDNNNLRLTVNGATYAVLPNTLAQNVNQTFGPFTVSPTGGTAILAQANGAATAGAIYAASVTATPVTGSGGGGNSATDGAVFGSREFINNGAAMTPASGGFGGGFLQINSDVNYECQQELWVAFPSTNSGPVLVTVCDEVYGSDPEDWKNSQT